MHVELHSSQLNIEQLFYIRTDPDPFVQPLLRVPSWAAGEAGSRAGSPGQSMTRFNLPLDSAPDRRYSHLTNIERSFSVRDQPDLDGDVPTKGNQ